MSEERIHTYMTAIGMVSICGNGTEITAVYLPCENLPAMADGEYDVMREAAAQIDEYLAGGRKSFDVPVSQHGTGFQTEVWEEISRIPFGKTARYAEVAERIGRPGSFRAVGTACSLNRIPIIVPCHRVVAADGSGNYLGGKALKVRLLKIEAEYR